jgi:hypothetical protein
VDNYLIVTPASRAGAITPSARGPRAGGLHDLGVRSWPTARPYENHPFAERARRSAWCPAPPTSPSERQQSVGEEPELIGPGGEGWESRPSGRQRRRIDLRYV